MRLVSWCSRLSHHFYVVRVPGSNPGGTIYCSPSHACSHHYHAAMLINFSKKQRREVSINRPASYEPAALPLRYPAFTSHVLCFFAPPFFIFFPFVFSMKMNIKFHRRESNPGRKRERLACYQLHHNGLLMIGLLRFLLPCLPLSLPYILFILPLFYIYEWTLILFPPFFRPCFTWPFM